MKLVSVALAVLLFVVSLSAIASAAGNSTVSISQNATVSMPMPANATIVKIGTFDNASVYVSGGANATIIGNGVSVDMGAADWMEYRDVYLFYRLPSGFASVSFDYDLSVGEKSNVLLVEFVDALPVAGTEKGGVPDTGVLGMGTWTNTNSWIKGMNDIGGLKTFRQGAHHVDIVASAGMLYFNVDGSTRAFNNYSPKKYLVFHLMVGDENSYLRGTVSGLKYDGPSPEDDQPIGGNGNTSGILIPNVTLNGKDNGANGGQQNVPGGKEPTPLPGSNTSKPLIELNIWLALAVAAGFFVAWAIVYTKYLKR